MGKKTSKGKWVQKGNKLVLTIDTRPKARRPTMLYSVEFNFGPKVILPNADKKYTRKKKHKGKED